MYNITMLTYDNTTISEAQKAYEKCLSVWNKFQSDSQSDSGYAYNHQAYEAECRLRLALARKLLIDVGGMP
jgi:hypothetical protein